MAQVVTAVVPAKMSSVQTANPQTLNEDATDLATALDLLNDIRQVLINAGLAL